MDFDPEVLEELTYLSIGSTLEGVTVMETEFQDSGRWSEHWRLVVKVGGEYYAINYELPSTEMQEGMDMFELNEDDRVDGVLVAPHQVTVTTYLPVAVA